MEQEEKTQEVANDNVTKVDLSGFKSKDDPSVIKVDLTKPPVKEEENAVREQSTDEVPVRDEPEASEEVQAENVATTTEHAAKHVGELVSGHAKQYNHATDTTQDYTSNDEEHNCSCTPGIVIIVLVNNLFFLTFFIFDVCFTKTYQLLVC